MITYFS